MNEIELHWAAGFIEGEGCFGIYDHKNGRGDSFKQVELTVGQVDRRPLEKLKLLFGGNIYGPYKNRQNSPCSYWRITNKKARDAAKTLIPLMLAKGEQAQKVLDTWEARPNKKRAV